MPWHDVMGWVEATAIRHAVAIEFTARRRGWVRTCVEFIVEGDDASVKAFQRDVIARVA
jgi:hypothetical protein